MHPQDEEKTAFITEAGAFCYKVMPFGLKNAGATYQRLMDKIFREIIGVNIEVYVDDMVVKSTEAKRHREALRRVFGIFRKHQLRLNPEKCSFGVHAGKFLGFMLTERGIEVNPDKCQAVIKMRSPQNVREVQQLMGRITALSCFISHSVETARPIFGTLKKAENFVWTAECEEAFLIFKAMLATPPVLTRPAKGIPLHLYISVSDVVVSAILVQECEGNQRSVYFISKVLQGAELRYQKIEKAALALVVTSRRLRPYFQNYGIIVKTNLPIRQVLRKPDLAGRMVAWSVQLSEFDISFERRGHVKAQALADFLTELAPREVDGQPEETGKGEWYLLVDGSSNQSGSGAGVILEGPTGIIIDNNQAEYEALLAGMRLAQELEAKRLTAKSDSKLVTGQRPRTGEVQGKSQQNGVDVRELHSDTCTSRPERTSQLICKVGQYAKAAAKISHSRKPASTYSRSSGGGMCGRERHMNDPHPLVHPRKSRPNDPKGARKITREASKYVVVGRHLYRRGFAFPLLRCVNKGEAEYVIKEVHEGICGTHIGGRALASKIARARYY
ncbi:Retrovirus-related Pol polyprotein from transposon 17.6, partial [Mucuna pruriens]